MRRIVGLAIFATVVLSGCASGEPDEPEFTPRSGTQSYDSVQALSDDLAAGGYDCGDVAIDTNSKFAAQAGRCSLWDSEIVLSIFSATTDRDSQVEATTVLLRDAGLEFGSLIGGNWIVNCGTESRCVELKGVLGGKIESGDETKPMPVPTTAVPPAPVVVEPHVTYKEEPYVAPVEETTTVPANPYPNSRGSNGAPTGQGGGVLIGCPSKLEQQPGTGIYQLDDGSTYFDWAPECL